MINNSIKYVLLSSLLLSLLLITPVKADDNSGLINFIKNNSLETLKNNPEKEEEFRILITSSKNKDVEKLKSILDNKNNKLEEKKLAVKALGLIKDVNSSVYLRDILINTKNKDLLYLSAQGLLEIGGDRNFEFVLNHLGKLKVQLGDGKLYYSLLANLAYNYKNDELLSRFKDYLKLSPDENMKAVYLYTIFGSSFGSVLSLDKNLNGLNSYERLNAAEILGEWYAAENAIMTFQDILLNSDDSKLRERAIIGLAEIGNFHARKELKLALNTAKSEDEKVLAKSLINELDLIVKDIKSKPAKTVKFNLFQQEYSKLFNSKGFYGSYDLMARNAKYSDIAKLERLRQTIMLNMTKDAAINYQKINEIIRDLRIEKEFSK